jgi:diguanylate cyclase (GGDEF)-like protein
VHHLYRWWLPLRRLGKTLLLIRQGQAPIDELSRITGPLGSFRMVLQAMLRELRQAKVELAICQHETRQRIAQRTDALERLVGSLRQQANRDPLTGLYNRRMLDQHLSTIVNRSRADNADLAVLMLDLDHFKILNDTLGHGAGDELLRTVGQLIRSSIRERDLAFRCGGDEFVILLPDHGFGVGHVLARRLVSLVDELGRTLRTPLPLGLSTGLVCASELSDPSGPGLLLEGDKRLYATKADRKAAQKRTAA